MKLRHRFEELLAELLGIFVAILSAVSGNLTHLTASNKYGNLLTSSGHETSALYWAYISQAEYLAPILTQQVSSVNDSFTVPASCMTENVGGRPAVFCAWSC